MKKDKSSFKRILDYLGKDKGLLIVASLMAVLSSAFTIIGPRILGGATTTLAKGVIDKTKGLGEVDLNKVLVLVAGAGALYLLSFISDGIETYIVTGISQRLIYSLRNKVSEKMNRLPVGYFETRTHGDILSIITNDIDQVGSGFADVFTQLGGMIISILGIIIVMFWMSPILAVVVLITVPLRLLYVKYNFKQSKEYYRKQFLTLAKINSFVEEKYTGFEVIKTFGAEEKTGEKFDELNDELALASRKSFLLSSLLNPVMLAIGNIGYIGVIVIGAFLAIRGSIGVGDIQAFLSYVNNINTPVQQLSGAASRYQSMKTSLSRLFEFLDADEEIDNGNAAYVEKANGEVTFKNVDFGYVENQVIIKDFSLDVKKGQRIAIVGPTGAGKTTLVKLLLRFYDINSGSILVDGTDIRTVLRQDLRSNFSMVLQETWLFQGSIMENIRFSRPNATDNEVIRAAKLSKADDFIKLLPGGYEFELKEDGINMSAGQRQLLTIARAFLADCPLLILDEATSMVDTRTEEKIQEAMNNLMDKRTCFVIAHRLSTIKNADVILVLKDGNIIEQGKHEELLSKKGFYYELYNAQYA